MSDCDESSLLDSIIETLGIMAFCYIAYTATKALVSLLFVVVSWVMRGVYYVIAGLLIALDHVIYDKKDRKSAFNVDNIMHPRHSRALVNDKSRHRITIGLMVMGFIGGVSATVLNSADYHQHTTVAETAQVTAKSLNVRRHPSATAQVEFKLMHLDLVKVFKQSDSWSYIQAGQARGWVASKYLAQTKSRAKKLSKQLAKLTVEKANARNLPSMKGKVLFQLQGDGFVNILKQQQGWSLISTNGYEGWVATKLLASQ
ncbi:SH3 domain-containing protein [Vibrio rarus]|uniref:SH3 domain-containing protein n=1 Tax=Vibrio rarus TaxID=413403 RepID=UPI0021C4B9DF|nr:SH3 domain-containing protein [Vibrio rarus]